MAGRRLSGSPTYLPAARALLRENRCIVRNIRPGLSGAAYCRAADRGIDTPLPLGPGSYAILAHEVGHQVLHRVRLQPGRHRSQRWIEELEAWNFAFASFERYRLPGLARARRIAGPRLHVVLYDELCRTPVPAKRRAQMLARLPGWAQPYLPRILPGGKLAPARYCATTA